MSDDLGTTLKQPIKVFYSYSHKNEKLRDKLSAHLSPLKRQGFIIEWCDREIMAGERWNKVIDERINEAQIILLLISSDFLDSDYCYEIEMKRAMERHENGEAEVIPIILQSCSLRGTPFEKLQALPRNAKPVGSWRSRDEAFTDIVEAIWAKVQQLSSQTAKSVAQQYIHQPATEQFGAGQVLNEARDAGKQLLFRATRSAASEKLRRMDLDQFGEQLLRREVEEIKVANPYLLGDRFVGREKELGDLTDWLVSDESVILCICDLGGTGKSALVWHWLNRPATREALAAGSIRQFWCSFYARNFDSMQFLRDLAAQLGGGAIVEPNLFEAQRKLQQLVLDRLRKENWLLVLDGLEREMGAFANPEHYQVDSEEQDRRNERGEVLVEERFIRSYIFADFLRELLRTQTKVLVTSRLFPENLMADDGQPLPGVIRYPFVPMSPEDAASIWNLSGEPDGSQFQRKFFECVGFHPQVISVVAAAVKEQSFNFSEWFGGFSEEAERQACLDTDTLLTVRRHRWLDLAMRDLIQSHRDAWLTICYIVRRSEASSVDALMDSLVAKATTDSPMPGRFRSDNKLREVLDYLVKRRLIGVGSSPEMVDVHPVIRGQVMNYILKQYEPGCRTDEELVRHLESADDHRNLLVRFLNQPNLEERFQSLSSALKGFSDNPSGQLAVLNILGKFYSDVEPGRRPWLDALPALRLRKDQAWVLFRTGHELMKRGLWEESSAVYNRARIAYHLCGDLQSVEDCRRSHDWQTLYGGGLLQSEQGQLDLLEEDGNRSEQFTPYWMALLLSIRQSEYAAELLQSLPAETNRWTLQTVAEAWFYLENYEKAETFARQAWDRREKEKDSVGQSLWEAVTLGLALVRLGRCDEAEAYLDFAKSRGTGWAYNLVPMFALAGLIEFHYREALKLNPGLKSMEELAKADLVYKQYRKSDPNNSFQIPAAEAHLAMAHVQMVRGESGEALGLARRALAIARGPNPPFHYGSVVRRATEFLVRKLKQSAPSAEDLGFEALNHELRLRAWIKTRSGA
jgi:tetratricopeptide (TPR) repeat protein